MGERIYHQEEHSNELKHLLEEYREVFHKGTGKAQNIEVHIHMKDDAKPVFYKPRPVLYAQKDGITEEVNSLVKAGVLYKVEFSNWAAPTIPVQKDNG